MPDLFESKISKASEFQNNFERHLVNIISKTTNLKTILKVINIWVIQFFSLNQRKLFRWMDLGKHYPLIGMMIL